MIVPGTNFPDKANVFVCMLYKNNMIANRYRVSGFYAFNPKLPLELTLNLFAGGSAHPEPAAC
jgi:hypothetical protein